MRYERIIDKTTSLNPISKNALPIPHKKISNFWNNLKIKTVDSIFDYDTLERYKNKYIDWIISSKRNNLKNLNNFKELTFTYGTTETFINFYAKYHNKRFRCFKGEYLFHKLNWRNNSTNWKYMEEEVIKKNDAVMISLPFSDSGDIHPMTNTIIEQCNKLNVPVCIDCAYMVIAKDIEFDFNQPSIECVTFSLSKGFWGIDKLRCGLRLKKIDEDDSIDIYNKWSCINLYSMSVAEKIFENFESDYNWNTFEDKYYSKCKEFDLKPTKCIIFGLGGKEYSEYNRGGNINRVCLSNALTDN